MNKYFFGLALGLGALSTTKVQAQTAVLAHPESDARGFLVFKIDKIIRVEGQWHRPLTVGEEIYPSTPTQAFPLARFGEAAILAFPVPDDLGSWQGVYIHNGYIPAMNACAAKTLIRALEEKRASGPLKTPAS